MHRPGISPHWQESFYFNWSTGDGRSFGLTRIGLNQTARKADAIVVTLHDGKPELVYAAVGQPIGPDIRAASLADGLTVGALTYTMVEPLRTWRIELRGSNRIDLTWQAFTPAVDFHAGFPGAGENSQHHFEQSGHVEGRLLVHGRAANVDAMGQRDKSWGARDWNGIQGWEWIAGQFGEDLSFNATLTNVNGVHTPAGFVFDGGAAHAVRAVTISYGGTDRHRPQTARIEIVSDGATYTVTGRARGRVPLFKRGLFIEETQCEFECHTADGVRRGAGVVEHAFHVGPAGLIRRLPRLARVAAAALKDAR